MYNAAAGITLALSCIALISGKIWWALIPTVVLIISLQINSQHRFKAPLCITMTMIFLFISLWSVIWMGLAIQNAGSLSEFEGPNGEGSPIAPIIGMFFYCFMFTIPWVLTTIRFIRSAFNKTASAEQDAAPNC
jgi:hypothetical protein